MRPPGAGREQRIVTRRRSTAERGPARLRSQRLSHVFPATRGTADNAGQEVWRSAISFCSGRFARVVAAMSEDRVFGRESACISAEASFDPDL